MELPFLYVISLFHLRNYLIDSQDLIGCYARRLDLAKHWSLWTSYFTDTIKITLYKRNFVQWSRSIQL